MNMESQSPFTSDEYLPVILQQATDADNPHLHSKSNDWFRVQNTRSSAEQKDTDGVFFAIDFPFKPATARTAGSFQATDLWSQFGAELIEKEQAARRIQNAYHERIEELRNYGDLDGIAMSKNSEKDFWAFVGMLPSVEGEIVLADNGNLRVVWEGEDGSHLGLEFLGDRLLQYVIFKQRKGSSYVSRVAGRDTFDGIGKQLQAFDIESLLYA